MVCPFVVSRYGICARINVTNEFFFVYVSGDSFTTYEQLITLGFDQELAFKAAAKYGNKMDKALAYIEQQQQPNKTSPNSLPQKSPKSAQSSIDEKNMTHEVSAKFC